MQTRNRLSEENSPYLLQHANNPVHWQPWTDSVFEQAQSEDKLVLISIGYSTCHWCHVMEKESFENEEVAALMNQHFICIKVDREEHPDVDKVYMNAVQIMTNRGGWPLNCITLPDGRPVYGGTYFPKDQWMHILRSLVHMKDNEVQKMEEYASQLKEGLSQSREFIPLEGKSGFDYKSHLSETVLRWKERLDYELGGLNRAPKFPLPSNIDFQLYYATYFSDETLLEYVYTTLDQMALGGLYDHVEGGFARYSVDHEWKVPHFEKMLYDNAQLLSTYALAYRESQNPIYKSTIFQTFDFLQRKMKDPNGGYYSAFDADSEGVEGKFYVWKLEELQTLLQEEWEDASIIFDFSPASYWEEGNYILRRNTHLTYVCEVLGLTLDEVEEKAKQITFKLKAERDKRVYPGLDYKQLTSWNALLLKGFIHCAETFTDDRFNTAARELFEWLNNSVVQSDKILRTVTRQQAKLDGTLEDYATLMEAYLNYGIFYNDVEAIEQVQRWTRMIEETFLDPHSGLFFFTPSDSTLFYRDLDVSDNVIPSANSILANVYLKLGLFVDDLRLVNKSESMLRQVVEDIPHYGSAYSNWASLALHFAFGMKKLKINNAMGEKLQLGHYFLPNVVVTLNKQNHESLLCTTDACSMIDLEKEGWLEKCRF